MLKTIIPNGKTIIANRYMSLHELEAKTQYLEKNRDDDPDARYEAFLFANGFLEGLACSGMITDEEYHEYINRILKTIE